MSNPDYIMPGRQVTVFLFLFNLAQWIVFTFEIQKVRASRVEEGKFSKFTKIIFTNPILFYINALMKNDPLKLELLKTCKHIEFFNHKKQDN